MWKRAILVSDLFLNANVKELSLKKSFDFQRVKNVTDKSSSAKAPPGFQVQISLKLRTDIN